MKQTHTMRWIEHLKGDNMGSESCPYLDEQVKLDPIMEELHDSQAGKGRHKCTYCAYIEGYNKAIADIESSLYRAKGKWK